MIIYYLIMIIFIKLEYQPGIKSSIVDYIVLILKLLAEESLKNQKTKRPYWRYNCEACLRCFNFCSQRAVVAGHSWGALLWYIGILVAYGGGLFTLILSVLPWLQSFRNWWTEELLSAIFYYPAFIMAYFLFFQLTRIKPLNSFFTFVSLDRFFGQYREPTTSLKNLTDRAAPTLR